LFHYTTLFRSQLLRDYYPLGPPESSDFYSKYKLLLNKYRDMFIIYGIKPDNFNYDLKRSQISYDEYIKTQIEKEKQNTNEIINMFENRSLDDEKINLTLNNEDVFDPFSFMNNKNIDIEMKDIEMKDNISESSYQNPTSPSYYDNPKHSKTLVEDNQVLTSPNMKFNFDKIEDINNIEDNDNNNDYQIPT